MVATSRLVGIGGSLVFLGVALDFLLGDSSDEVCGEVLMGRRLVEDFLCHLVRYLYWFWGCGFEVGNERGGSYHCFRRRGILGLFGIGLDGGV